MSVEESGRPRGRWQVPALALAFFGPVVLAWVMVVMGWYPEGTTNNGRLVEPPERVEARDWNWADGSDFDPAWFRGRWTVLMAQAGDCHDGCMALLDELGRSRLALDKDRIRVDILLAQPPGVAPPSQRVPHRVRIPQRKLQRLMETAPDGSAPRAIYIVDTDGYRMMTYPMPLRAGDLVEDLEQLLRNSDADAERLQRMRQGAR